MKNSFFAYFTKFDYLRSMNVEMTKYFFFTI